MEILSLEQLEDCNGGVNWGRVGMGALQVGAGLVGGTMSSWTGAGAVIGGVTAIDGVGVVISGFED